MQVAQAINTFLTHCQTERSLDTKTLDAYRYDLHQFSSFLQEKNIAEAAHITREEIKEYAGSMTQLSLSSKRRKITVLKTFFSYQKLSGNVAVNPFHEIKLSVKPPKTLPKTITLSQVNGILSAAYKEQQAKKKRNALYAYRQSTRDIAVLELLFATGIQLTEVCSLKADNISADFSFITIDGKGCRCRKLPIDNPSVRAALIAYHECFKKDIKKTFFLNHWRQQLSEQSIRYMVARYARKAKIIQRITPSVLRHTFASLLVENDVNIHIVQHIMGHSSVSVTQRYANVTHEKGFEVLRSKNPRNLLNITRS